MDTKLQNIPSGFLSHHEHEQERCTCEQKFLAEMCHFTHIESGVKRKLGTKDIEERKERGKSPINKL